MIRPAYAGRIPASRVILDQIGTSAQCRVDLAMQAMIGQGTPADATRPNHEETSKLDIMRIARYLYVM